MISKNKQYQKYKIELNKTAQALALHSIITFGNETFCTGRKQERADSTFPDKGGQRPQGQLSGQDLSQCSL